MNILLDGLPDTVDVGGEEYPINSGFRSSILFELLMQDSGVPNEQKVIQALQIYFPEIPQDLKGAVDAMTWFYSCGKPPKQHVVEDDSDDYEDSEPGESNLIYSFEYDASYIYAAFLEQYGIDLVEVSDEDMHWWKFKALFDSLSENTQFMKITGYRGIKISNKMSRDQKDFYRRMKKIYALPLSQAEVDKRNAIIEALKNGKDVSSLL